MAREHTKETRSVTTATITKMTCDICGKEAPRPQDLRSPWSEDDFPAITCGITLFESWPDDWVSESEGIDICPECMQLFIDAIKSRSVSLCVFLHTK